MEETKGAVPGSWIWQWSGQPVSYFNWKTGDPDHKTALGMIYRATDGLWDDRDRDRLFTYICERDQVY